MRLPYAWSVPPNFFAYYKKSDRRAQAPLEDISDKKVLVHHDKLRQRNLWKSTEKFKIARLSDKKSKSNIEETAGSAMIMVSEGGSRQKPSALKRIFV